MEYPEPEFSRKQIVSAGKVLAQNIPPDKDSIERTLPDFRVAHNWRSSYIYPMRRVRAELQGQLRRHRCDALSAARLKRMSSIRKKLKTSPLTLYQMQDIGGCRAIIRTVDEMNILVDEYINGASGHTLLRHDDYIKYPRLTGYRSSHFVLKYKDADGNDIYNRQFIEVQLRTRLQHSWATAVEAVGLVQGEDMKGGSGDADWLRLFQIMASEFAEIEGTASVTDVTDNRILRRKELRDIDRRIEAVATLESYNNAIKDTENFANISSPFFLIQYDTQAKKVAVRPFNFPTQGSSEYIVAEVDTSINSVLVEVEKVSDLRAAYPNYFLDVTAFAQHLKRIVGGNRLLLQNSHWWQYKDLHKK